MAICFHLAENMPNGLYLKYRLSGILFLLIYEILCGCENAEAIIRFGEIREEFFLKHSELESILCVKDIHNVLRTREKIYFSAFYARKWLCINLYSVIT